MNLKMAKRIQKLCKWISFNSVGKSAPPGIREKKISKELKEAVEKLRLEN